MFKGGFLGCEIMWINTKSLYQRFHLQRNTAEPTIHQRFSGSWMAQAQPSRSFRFVSCWFHPSNSPKREKFTAMPWLAVASAHLKWHVEVSRKASAFSFSYTCCHGYCRYIAWKYASCFPAYTIQELGHAPDAEGVDLPMVHLMSLMNTLISYYFIYFHLQDQVTTDLDNQKNPSKSFWSCLVFGEMLDALLQFLDIGLPREPGTCKIVGPVKRAGVLQQKPGS
jgi:hypothetical protein